jgi:hypothetical protein
MKCILFSFLYKGLYSKLAKWTRAECRMTKVFRESSQESVVQKKVLKRFSLIAESPEWRIWMPAYKQWEATGAAEK